MDNAEKHYYILRSYYQEALEQDDRNAEWKKHLFEQMALVSVDVDVLWLPEIEAELIKR